VGVLRLQVRQRHLKSRRGGSNSRTRFTRTHHYGSSSLLSFVAPRSGAAAANRFAQSRCRISRAGTPATTVFGPTS
jgi:hypothetical protein